MSLNDPIITGVMYGNTASDDSSDASEIFAIDLLKQKVTKQSIHIMSFKWNSTVTNVTYCLNVDVAALALEK
jgi:hypothetical protein